MMVHDVGAASGGVRNTPEYGVISMNSLAADNPISERKVF